MDKSNLSEADVLTLVRLVQEKPCIWDKTCNKDPTEKRKAWREIFEHFAGCSFDLLDENERKRLEQDLTAKWTNLRDTFIKQVKKRREQQYKHYENMKFLLKNIDLESMPSTSAEETSLQSRERYRLHSRSTPFRHIKKSSPTLAIALKKKRKRFSFVSKVAKRSSYSSLNPRVQDTHRDSSDSLPSPTASESQRSFCFSSPNQNVEESQITVQVPSCPEAVENSVNSSLKTSPEPPVKKYIPEEDLAFFRSIVPHLEKMSTDEKLEFQIGVLETIKRIKNSQQ